MLQEHLPSSAMSELPGQLSWDIVTTAEVSDGHQARLKTTVLTRTWLFSRFILHTESTGTGGSYCRAV